MEKSHRQHTPPWFLKSISICSAAAISSSRMIFASGVNGVPELFAISIIYLEGIHWFIRWWLKKNNVELINLRNDSGRAMKYLSTSNFGGAWTLNFAINFGDTFAGYSNWFARAASAKTLPYFNVSWSLIT